MRGGHDVAEVEQGLLSHAKVYQARSEAVKQGGKTQFVPGVKGELWEGAGEGGEVWGSGLPRVVGL